MPEQALIDGLKFASEARRLAGELALAAMPRLQDSILEPLGCVQYALIGTSDRHGQPLIEVHVRGTVPLQCQRCLERLDYGLDRTSRLALVAPGAQLPDVAQEDPDTEAIAAAEVANVADLIEQEVLLGLPLVLLIALGIQLSSTGGVLYRQTRCGLNGRRFTLYKFRTMVEDAHARRLELLHLNEMDGPAFKLRRDPRLRPALSGGAWTIVKYRHIRRMAADARLTRATLEPALAADPLEAARQLALPE